MWTWVATRTRCASDRRDAGTWEHSNPQFVAACRWNGIGSSVQHQIPSDAKLPTPLPRKVPSRSQSGIRGKARRSEDGRSDQKSVHGKSSVYCHSGSSRNQRVQAELVRVSCAGDSSCSKKVRGVVCTRKRGDCARRDEFREVSKIGAAENPNGRSIQSQGMFDRGSSGTWCGVHVQFDASQTTSICCQGVDTRCVGIPARGTGSSLGPGGGCTYEPIKVLLDDRDTFDLLFGALSNFAQGATPPEVSGVLTSARLTAIAKPDGGVRGIATGTTIRRVVARTLAKQFIKTFEEECSPFWYALSTRAGTDCVGHMLRAITDNDPIATVLKVDGIDAYDHVLRTSMLERLFRMPGARSILPFVNYRWFDDQGRCREVTQAEDGEQGDPSMRLLFSIGIQGALEEVSGC